MSKIFVAVLALALAALAGSVHAEWQWKHFGAAPYAASREEAMKTRENAFRKLGFPEQVVILLAEETKKQGEKTTLKVGDRFSAQISKNGVVHGLNEGGGIVAFESPVRGMEYVANAEKWHVTFEGRTYTVLLPEVCFNWTSIIGQLPPTTTSLLTVTNRCPNGRTLTANAWSLKALPEELRKKAEGYISVANNRSADPDAYKADAVSRTLGGQLRREVKVRTPITTDIRVAFRNPQTLAVVQDSGVLHIAEGVGSMTISGDQLGMIIETVWPKEFVSPTVSGGEHRLWFFPEEWKNYCAMNIHGLVP